MSSRFHFAAKPTFAGPSLALMLCMLAPAVLCAQDTLLSYSVTLRAAMAVDAPEAIAAELAADYGGTLAEPARGLTFAMRLSPSRARVLARDPRVESMVVQAAAAPAIAEAMNWGTGVTYTYDGAGNVRKIGTDPFVYDAVSRLVQADTNGVRRNYEYDGFGNRTKCRQSAGTPVEGECQQAFTITPANNRVEGATYDAAGNVTVLGGHTYTYDALNMQTRDTGGPAPREFLYTANDERIAVYTVGQSWRWTIRDTSAKVLREFASYDGPNGLGTESWQWTKDYVWRDGLLLASRQMVGSSVTTYHYHLDHLGSPRRVTDASDRIVGVHDYIPFGPEASGGQQEPTLSLLKYTGHERDLLGAESWDTLDYMHARLYSPVLGRFLSVDKVGGSPARPQSWNRYSYTRNNPLRLVDPDGNKEIEFTIRHFIPDSTVQLPHGRNVGDGRNFSLRADASVRTERTIRIETDPAVNRSGVVGIDPPRIGRSENLWFGLSGRASGASMTAEVSRIPSTAVLITATQNEAEPVPMSLTAPQAALFVTGRGGIRSTVNILVTEDASQILVFGSRSSFPAMEINATVDGQTFAIYRGNESKIPGGFGIFGTESIDRTCANSSGAYTCK